MSVTIGLAFLAGLASFLSPCVLSLVPAYIGYLSGRSVKELKSGEITNPWTTFLHGLLFVLGFSVVFIGLGVAVSAFGGLLFNIRDWVSKIGGIIIIILGLHISGIVYIKYLDYDLRPKSRLNTNRSYLTSFFIGVFFAAGWSPCVGPVLGAILTLTLQYGSITNGLVLLSVYSLGLAIPFLFSSIAIRPISKVIIKYKSLIRYFEIFIGIILIILGFMLFWGIFEQLSRFGFLVDFGI